MKFQGISALIYLVIAIVALVLDQQVIFFAGLVMSKLCTIHAELPDGK